MILVELQVKEKRDLFNAIQARFPWFSGKPKEMVMMIDDSDKPIQHIRNLTTSLTARDTVVNEMLPAMIEEAVKILHYSESQPKIPYRLSVLIIDPEGNTWGENIIRSFGEMTNAPLAISLCRDQDCANRLCDGRVFNAVICWENINGISAADIASDFETKGHCYPFIVVSNGTETTEVTLEGSRNVYMVIDEETALNAKALELACKQTAIRHKEKIRIRHTVEELIRLFGVMERVKCRLVT